MAHREFRTADGRDWAVWSVRPEYAERRAADASTSTQLTAERRAHANYRVPLADAYTNGWLCFETSGEKRRLAPVPEAWAKLSDAGLIDLCERAARVEQTGRRLVE